MATESKKSTTKKKTTKNTTNNKATKTTSKNKSTKTTSKNKSPKSTPKKKTTKPPANKKTSKTTSQKNPTKTTPEKKLTNTAHKIKSKKVIYTELRDWWVYLVLGILVLLLGGSLLANPMATLATVSTVVSIYFIVAGFSVSCAAYYERKELDLWGLHLGLNIGVLLFGILVLTKPFYTVSYLWLVTGIAFLLESATMIIMAFNYKKTNSASWIFLLIFGILIGLSSVLILINPIFGIGYLTLFTAMSVIFFGVNLIVLALQFKPRKQE